MEYNSMANKVKVKTEEVLTKGNIAPETTPVTEAKTMKSLSKTGRAQVQDEYDIEKEEKGCSMEEAKNTVELWYNDRPEVKAWRDR